jgi:hypothetical protein
MICVVEFGSIEIWLLTNPRNLLTKRRDLLTKPRDLLTKPRDLLTKPRDFQSRYFMCFHLVLLKFGSIEIWS